MPKELIIDLEKKVASSSDWQKKIVEFHKARKDSYRRSNCFRILEERVKRLKDAVNMKSPVLDRNSFNSKLNFSLVRQAYLLRRGVTKKAFRQDPLLTLDPLGNTPMENAENAQEVLNLNLGHTKFRQKCFDRLVDSASSYGSFVCMSQFMPTIRYGYQTVYNPGSVTIYERTYGPLGMTKNVHNSAIHVLNYFQDPDIADADDSTFKGFEDRVTLAKLIGEVRQYPDAFIVDNVKKVIEKGKEHSIKSGTYYHDSMKDQDYDHITIDIDRVYAKIPIKGNEESEIEYYFEVCGDDLIRFETNQYDQGICPLTAGTFRRRSEFWWGHADPEDVIPEDNYMNLMMNMTADQALQLLDAVIFVPEGMIDNDKWQNRAAFGGLVEYNAAQMRNIQQAVFPWQRAANSTQTVDWITREVKEQAQRKLPSPDFARGYNQGGLNNKTATAAHYMMENADVLESDMLEVFGDGISTVGMKNVVLLQQYLADMFDIRPDIKQPARTLQKFEILGQFAYRISNALQKSKVTEFQRLHNILTGLINFKSSGLPEFAPLVLNKLIRKYIKMADIEDVDEIYNTQQAMQSVPGYVQTQQIPGQEMAGAVQERPTMNPMGMTA